jgi:N-acetylglucosaminyldiphosphoundecaprenol N-acetyl-beta-D-mannosaminyltransferase
VKRAGLQWVHRLAQDPRHLWWRYLRNNPAFVLQIAMQCLRLREYPQAKAVPAISNEGVAAGEPQRVHAGQL